MTLLINPVYLHDSKMTMIDDMSRRIIMYFMWGHRIGDGENHRPRKGGNDSDGSDLVCGMTWQVENETRGGDGDRP